MPRRTGTTTAACASDEHQQAAVALSAWRALGGIARSLDAVEPAVDDCVPFTAVAEVAGGHRPGAGAGFTLAVALAAAAAEAVERNFAADVRGPEAIRAAPADLGHECVDPRDLVLYTDAPFVVRPHVAAYDERRPVDWTRARWLDSGEPVWVPALLAHFGFEPDWRERFCVSTTNGLAAGVDIDRTERAAVYELVERDAVTITWLARRRGVRLRLDGGDLEARETARRMERLGAEVELYSLDAGLGLPVVLCVAFGDGAGWPGAVAGSAAAATIGSAARRALLETATIGPQLRRLLQAGERAWIGRPPRDRLDHAIHYFPVDRRSAFDFIRSAPRDAVDIARLEADAPSPLGEWAARARSAGVRVALADVTSPSIAHTPWHVVRALGTNAQPLDFGMRFQRLANPRLERFLDAAAPNPDPHPLA